MFEKWKWNKSDFRKTNKNLSVKEILKTNSSNRRKTILGKKKQMQKVRAVKKVNIGKHEQWPWTMT